MVLRTVLCVACCPLLSAFGAGRAPLPSTVAPRASPLHMGSPAVVAKKAAIVEEVKATMEDAALMFCVRSEGIKVNELNMMRQKFDDSVTIRCVKNTLVKRATEDVPKFQGGESLLEYSNYWFFVPEDQMRPAVDTWSEWIKETKIEENDIFGGVFGGQLLDKDGVVEVSKLPTKQELMGTTATLLTVLPTKLARGIKQAGAQRLAKAAKLAGGQKLVQAVKAMEGKKE